MKYLLQIVSLTTCITNISVADIDSRLEDAQLFASPSVSGDAVAFSVGASDQTIVLGAYLKNYAGNGYDSGALYIFDRDTSGWTQSAYLAASDGAAFDYLGWSVDIEGDLIAAGASWANETGIKSGAVYMFRRGKIWEEEVNIVPSDLPADANFGHDVDLDGSRLIVGAPYVDGIVNAQGVAYIFRDDGGAWIQEARLAPGDLDVNFVGAAVAIDGNFAVIGSPRDNGDGISAGSAFIYELDIKGNWTLVGRFTPDETEPYSYFGNEIAIEGDTILVGAEYSDQVGANVGAVFVYERSGGSWSQTQVLTPDDMLAWSHFGGSIDIQDDLVVIGAYGDPNATGAAHLYTRGKDGQFSLESRLLAGDGVFGERFGNAVAVGGDAVVVGAPYWTERTGCAYVFDINTPPLRDGRRPRLRGNAMYGTMRSGISFEYFGNFDDHDYFVTASAIEYYDAHKVAQVLGDLLDRPANLATVNSLEENDFVQSLSLELLWIGLSDLDIEGNFAWDSGESVNWTGWGPGEPNKNAGTEDVVVMNWQYDGGKTFGWTDWKEQHRYAQALIEIDGEACTGDVDMDGDVDADDLAITIETWGDMGGAGDANHDGAVNVNDILWLLGYWGACP